MRSGKPANEFLLVGNPTYHNRGGEAIVRGTKEILRREFGNAIKMSLGVHTSHGDLEGHLALENDPSIDSFAMPSSSFSRWTRYWWEHQANRWLGTQLAGKDRALEQRLSRVQALLQVGGDNYTLDYGIPRRFIEVDRRAQARGVPVVLWGASIGPFDSHPDFAQQALNHLNSVSLILVRDSLSQAYLAANGILENVRLVADPAFVMEAEPAAENGGAFSVPSGTIGLNLSPLIGERRSDAAGLDLDSWTAFCTRSVRALTQQTGRDLLLIPHVFSDNPQMDDRGLLKKVWEETHHSATSHVRLVPDGLSAPELKWLISKCEVFVGARTHSTIAALSSCVPTLSIGYSAKATGLNQDVFGSTDFVLDASRFQTADLVEGVQVLLSRRNEIAETLRTRLPGVQARAFQAGKYLHEVSGGIEDGGRQAPDR